MEYISIQVKSIWNGMVGVRDKYITECQKRGCGLKISVNGEYMLIDNVDQEIVMKSKKPFYDKFSNNYHWLYYFSWKPFEEDKSQLKLI